MLPLINSKESSLSRNLRLPGCKYNQISKKNLGKHSYLNIQNKSFEIPKRESNENACCSFLQKGSCHTTNVTQVKQSNSFINMRKLKKNTYISDKQNSKSIRKIKNWEQKQDLININGHRTNDIKSQFRLGCKKFLTKQKPAHRYKTTMLVFRHCLLLYGGLGCEKNLTWARLNFQTMNWQINRQLDHKNPLSPYIAHSPVYGHTMVKYKDTAIIYGGTSTDQTNQTTILHTRTTPVTVTQASRCPVRRKQHAAVIMGDLMVVHGGIESRETRSQLLIYNIITDKWNIIPNLGLPCLSGHKIVKGKNNKQGYIFGGLNSKGKSTNKLYKLKNIGGDLNEYKWQLIQCVNPPKARHSFCLQKISNNYLLLYGGRQDNQTDDELQNLQNGIFSDIWTYSIDQKVWNKILNNNNHGNNPSLFKIQPCYGMASTVCNGTVFIYGGSNSCRYNDAGFILLWNEEEKTDPWESKQSSQLQIYSSKKISQQFIIF